MTSNLRLLALDIGAESGRGVVGAFDGDRLTIEEVARFANVPVTSGDTLSWDFPRLLADVRSTIASARSSRGLASVGIDTWGVDYGLVDSGGRLLEEPCCYRDSRTDGAMDAVFARLPR